MIKNFSHRLSELMRREGYSQSELARRLGVRPSTVNGWVVNNVVPQPRIMDDVAKLFRVSVEWLRTGNESVIPDSSRFGEDETQKMREGVTAYAVKQGQAHPHYGEIPNALAPQPIPLITMSQARNLNRIEDVYATFPRVPAFGIEETCFAVPMETDAMAPKISAGSQCIIYPSWEAQQGDVVFCRLNTTRGRDVMIRIFSLRESGKAVVLTSYNPAFPELQFARADFDWIYPVGAVTSTLRNK